MDNSTTVIPKIVAVAYDRWSFIGDSNYKALTGKNFSVLVRWSLTRGGHI